MTRQIEVDNLPSVMTDDEETVEESQGHRRDREEFHGDRSLPGDYGEK
jgi:hypothetical protein